MNTLTDKWNRFNISESLYEEKTSYDYFNHFKTPYYTTIKPNEHKKHSNRENEQSSSTKFNDRHYRKNKKEKYEDIKELDGNKKFQKRLVGYSKYNLDKETYEASKGEEINNNMIIRKNLEKKNANQRENASDNVCDSKSINSLETQNTINEDEFYEEPPCSKSKKFQTEDLKQIKEKNLKLSYVNTHNFDFNKYKEKSTESSQFEDSSFRKHHSDHESYMTNKFSQPNCYNNSFEMNRGATPFNGYLFNPFMMENNFPMFTQPQFSFGSFIHNYYYMNNMGFSSNNNMYSQNSCQKNSGRKEKRSLMEEMTNLKEECEKLNRNSCKEIKNIEAIPASKLVEYNVDSASQKKETNLKGKNEKTNKNKKDKLLTITVKISEQTTKTLNLSSTADAFNTAKQFCRENGLSGELFYSVYTRISSALEGLVTLSESKERQLQELLSNTSQILAKVKRSHSYDCPSGRYVL